MTIEKKLAVVEHLIEDFRWARDVPAAVEHETYVTLKAMAADLRAQLPNAPESARRKVGQRVATAVKSECGFHPHMVALAQDVVACWPVIEQALERYAIELKRREASDERREGVSS